MLAQVVPLPSSRQESLKTPTFTCIQQCPSPSYPGLSIRTAANQPHHVLFEDTGRCFWQLWSCLDNLRPLEATKKHSSVARLSEFPLGQTAARGFPSLPFPPPLKTHTLLGSISYQCLDISQEIPSTHVSPTLWLSLEWLFVYSRFNICRCLSQTLILCGLCMIFI